ncbi:hypothetical protein IW261DRAFT_1406499 [Armillaria novae-zelandiae]|uniref:Nephrocystin 3-like N-terminal domain-containing protein n=1 Tax=Armillaria novae-zelandiae TaxID=153914 RepID=A0AA39NRW8_9AGAR|nr:hypothetical protein IW261DRAFT_1406499 [Armillaria novae-zelandiae]
MRCQPDTRLEVIKTVTNWVFDASGDQTKVLWLYGLAGSGKSTLATSIANYFAKLNRLGAFIFFSRDTKEQSVSIAHNDDTERTHIAPQDPRGNRSDSSA